MNRGFIIFYATILILSVMLAVAGSMYVAMLSNQKIARNIAWSAQAYYAAESGLEDATMRIKNLLPYPSSYVLQVGSSHTAVTVSANGTARTVESDGQWENRTRKLQAVLAVSTNTVSFFYGVQVGTQGLSMGQGSSVIGNIFSNGSIEGAGKSKTTVTGTAQAAGTSEIGNITVNGDAYAYALSDCAIGGRASYVFSMSNCSASSSVHVPQQLAPQNFPIPQSQIDAWEADAQAGGTLAGYTLGNNASGTLGPKKINGNITFGNGSTLTLKGTVWVTGAIHLGNSDIIQLDPGYRATGGVLILGGSADIGNGVSLNGSGQAGSELMLLSTYGPGTALNIGNTQASGIYYAPNGTIQVGNGLHAKEITANGVNAGNNVTITYQTGFASMDFSSGPGGSFQVHSWKEIQ